MGRWGLSRFFARSEVNATKNLSKTTDLIQARYGWTDQIIFDLSAARFLQIANIVLEAYQTENRQKYQLEAYNAWQITELIKMLVTDKAKPVKFSDYLKKIGLSDKAENPQDKKIAAAAAITTAEQIKQLDQAARK
jgi:hypothetical protein